MSDFFLKRFEIGGLNCLLSNVSIGKCKSNFLSDVLQRLSRTDKRFHIATKEVESQPSASLPIASRFSRQVPGIAVPDQSKGDFNFSKDCFDLDSKSPDMPVNDRLSICSRWRKTTRLIQTIRWTDPSDSLNLISFLSNIESPDQLSARRDELCRNDFRYSIADRDGNLVSTGFDSDQPIFSEQGPVVESGFTVRIALVSEHQVSQRVPILARAAVLNSDMKFENEYESEFCF